MVCSYKSVIFWWQIVANLLKFVQLSFLKTFGNFLLSLSTNFLLPKLCYMICIRIFIIDCGSGILVYYFCLVLGTCVVC